MPSADQIAAPAAPVDPAFDEEHDDEHDVAAPEPNPALVADPPVAQVPASPPAAAPAQAPAQQGVAHPHAPLPQVHPETIVAATWEGLNGKPARTDKVLVPSTNADGDEVLLEMKMKAISNTKYDALLDKYPPKREAQQQGAIWDREKFPPALLTEVVTSPKLTYEQWMELSTSDNWSGGEFGDLFTRANRLCQGNLDVPFIGRG